MLGMPKASSRPTWKRVEDDFVLGACAHRIFGFMSAAPDGAWTAFDEDAESVGTFADERDAREALWARHEPAHLDGCTPVRLAALRGPVQQLAALSRVSHSRVANT